MDVEQSVANTYIRQLKGMTERELFDEREKAWADEQNYVAHYITEMLANHRQQRQDAERVAKR